MKFNRYITLALATVVAFASCQKEVGDGLSDQNKDKERPAAALSVVSALDDTLVFNVAASGAEVSQYGWVIFEGTGNEAPAALDIVIDEVSGSLGSGVFDCANDGTDSDVAFEVEPYGEYQIFAAAITKTGLASEVVKIDVVVGDTVSPDIDDYDYEDDSAVMYLLMTEPVKYVEGKEITATLYSGYYQTDSQGNPVFVMADPQYALGTAKAEVTVDGDEVTLDFGEQNTGTMYAVDIPAGAFVDMSGNAFEGFTSIVGFDPVTGTNEIDGLVALVKYGTFAFEPASEIPASILVKDWKQAFTFNAPFDLFEFSKKATGKAVYTVTVGKSKTTREFDLTSGVEFGMMSNTVLGVMLPDAPLPGESVTVTIPAGIAKDMYGNTNQAVTFGPILFMAEPFNMDITVDDIIYNGAIADFAPNNDEIVYFYSYAEASEVEGMTGEEIYAADLAYYQKLYGNRYAQFGYDSFAELFIENFCMAGESSLNLNGYLDPETDYVVYACAIKDDLSMDSELFTAEFTTPGKPGPNPDYTALLGTYTCPVFSSRAKDFVNCKMVVEEDVVNETFAVYFPGDYLTPDATPYIDKFTAYFDEETKGFAIISNVLGSEGYSWNFGVGVPCGIHFCPSWYTSEEVIEYVLFAPSGSGELSLFYPSVPADDNLIFWGDVYTEDGDFVGPYGYFVFAEGTNFTKAASGPNNVPASKVKKDFREDNIRVKNAVYSVGESIKH